MTELRRRLLLLVIRASVGGLTGTVVGLLIAGFAAVVYALPKAADIALRLGPLRGVAFAAIAGGSLTGLVAGVFGTLARGPASAAVVGLFAMLPLYLSALLLLRGPPAHWSGWDVAVILALSAVTGGSAGARLWVEVSQRDQGR